MKRVSKNNILACVVIFVVALVVYVVIYQKIPEVRRFIMSDKQLFTDIYTSQEWEGWKGVGPGSTIEDGAKPFLDFLQDFIDSHDNINSIVDIGCGYGELLKGIHLRSGTQYLGLDIVDSVIEYNRKHYVRNNFTFKTVNTVEDLAKYKGDLLILKDVIQHWSIEQILFAKKHIIPNFKYAIVVNNIRTAWKTTLNGNIKTGSSRPLDLTAAPFFMNPKYIKDYSLPPFRVKRIHVFINSMEQL